MANELHCFSKNSSQLNCRFASDSAFLMCSPAIPDVVFARLQLHGGGVSSGETTRGYPTRVVVGSTFGGAVELVPRAYLTTAPLARSRLEWDSLQQVFILWLKYYLFEPNSRRIFHWNFLSSVI